MNAMQPPQSIEEIKAGLETTEKGGVRQSIRNCLTVIPYAASNICRTTAKEKNRRAADIFSRPNDNAAVLRNQSRRVLSCDDIKDMAA